MKRIATAVLMMAMVVVLAGCGTTFTRRVDPLKSSETFGVVVLQQISVPGKLSAVHVSDKIDTQAAEVMGKVLEEQFQQKGYGVKIIPADKAADLVAKYKGLPRNFRRVVSDPDKAELGDLKALFKENGIDRLLIYEGESVARPSAVVQAYETAATLLISALGGSAMGVSTWKPISFTYTSAVTEDGRFCMYNREQFTRNGDWFYYPDRKGMVEAAVTGWLKEMK